MIHIAIVEDNADNAQLIEEYIVRYQTEKKAEFSVTSFSNGLEFISGCVSKFDIVFMDIEMPHLDGMKTAKKLRELDENICIIFTTNLAQYAVKGYEVNALDFMVKPLDYFNLTLKLERAIHQRARAKKDEIIIQFNDGLKRISVSEIYYVEVSGHLLTYHTAHGALTERETMKNKEKQLMKYHFSRCNNCYLVNLRHVSEVRAQSITVSGDILSVSRSRKKEFMDELTTYIGENIL